jgi:zinc D-Ala-D-Ala carboxypeptidase
LSWLTPHFSIREAICSSVAIARKIDNTPPEALLPAIERTAEGMERIRAYLGGKPITIHSWYRSPELNRAVGGARASQHMRGEAVDFTAPHFGSVRETARALAPKVRELGIDQLILEHSWIHVSFAEVPRYELLTVELIGNRVSYARGIL